MICSFKMVGNDRHDNVLVTAQEAILNDKSKTRSSAIVAAANDEGSVEHDSGQIEDHRTNKEELIAREDKSAVQELIISELPTIFEGLLKSIPRTTLPSAQIRFPSVVYNFFEQVMLDLLREGVTGKMLKAHIVKGLNTNAPAVGLSSKFPASISFMAPIATFVRRRSDTAMEEKKYSFVYTSKEPANAEMTVNDDSKTPPSRFDCGDDEVPRWKSAKCHSKRHQNTERNKYVNRFSCSSKSST